MTKQTLNNQRIKNIRHNTVILPPRKTSEGYVCKVTSKCAPHVFGMGSGETAKDAFQDAYTDYRQGAWGK